MYPFKSTLLIVMLAGSLGVGFRYLLSLLINAHTNSHFPWATLMVNIMGAFAIGVVIALLGNEKTALHTVLIVGLLGGFTTYSTFVLETIRLAQQGHVLASLAYWSTTNTLTFAACIIGLNFRYI